MKRFLKAIYWRARIILLALRWVRRFSLGDRVILDGRHWTLIQGVSAPRWTLSSGAETVRAHESEFRKVRSLRNYWGSFASGYRFYMRNWYGIWMCEGIKPWMRGCNIWGRR